MARFLIRATMSPDVLPVQKEVLERNRRIGVGIYGFQEFLLKQHNAAYSSLSSIDEFGTYLDVTGFLEMLYDKVVCVANKYCDDLGIASPIKYTTAAPTGTISLLSGTSSGIQPIFAKYFKRRVRFNKFDDQLVHDTAIFEQEDDVVDDSSIVATYLCADPIVYKGYAKVESVQEISIFDQLEVQLIVQKSWADNAVSYTVNLPEDCDVDDLREAFNLYGPCLKGFTVFPMKSFEQAPIEPLTRNEYERLSIEHYERTGIPVSNLANSYGDGCESGACPVR